MLRGKDTNNGMYPDICDRYSNMSLPSFFEKEGGGVIHEARAANSLGTLQFAALPASYHKIGDNQLNVDLQVIKSNQLS